MDQNTWDTVLTPAIKGGALDSVNPGAMACWLLLVVVMVVAARKYAKMVPYGSLFILGVFMARTVIVTGFLDQWLLSDWFQLLLEVWYLIFSVMCLVVGGLFWKDWTLSRRKALSRKAVLSYDRLIGTGDLPLPIPFFKRPKKWRWLFASVGRGLLFLLLGGLAAFLATAWPEDGYFVFMFLSLMASQNFVKLFIMVGCYAFLYVFPLILVFFSTWSVFRGKKSAERLRTRYSLLQVIGSALFLGYGISFLSYYIN